MKQFLQFLLLVSIIQSPTLRANSTQEEKAAFYTTINAALDSTKFPLFTTKKAQTIVDSINIQTLSFIEKEELKWVKKYIQYLAQELRYIKTICSEFSTAIFICKVGPLFNSFNQAHNPRYLNNGQKDYIIGLTSAGQEAQ